MDSKNNFYVFFKINPKKKKNIKIQKIRKKANMGEVRGNYKKHKMIWKQEGKIKYIPLEVTFGQFILLLKYLGFNLRDS